MKTNKQLFCGDCKYWFWDGPGLNSDGHCTMFEDFKKESEKACEMFAEKYPHVIRLDTLAYTSSYNGGRQ